MKLADYILILAIAVCFTGALVYTILRRKSGGCSGCGSGCGSCAGCSSRSGCNTCSIDQAGDNEPSESAE